MPKILCLTHCRIVAEENCIDLGKKDGFELVELVECERDLPLVGVGCSDCVVKGCKQSQKSTCCPNTQQEMRTSVKMGNFIQLEHSNMIC